MMNYTLHIQPSIYFLILSHQAARLSGIPHLSRLRAAATPDNNRRHFPRSLHWRSLRLWGGKQSGLRTVQLDSSDLCWRQVLSRGRMPPADRTTARMNTCHAELRRIINGHKSDWSPRFSSLGLQSDICVIESFLWDPEAKNLISAVHHEEGKPEITCRCCDWLA